MAKEMNWKSLIEKDLKPGEKILWESATESFDLLSGIFKSQIVRKWLTTSVVMLGLIAAYVLKVSDVKTSLVVMLAAIYVALMAGPFTEQRSVKGQYYFLTNQRAIMIRSDRTAHFMNLSDVDDAQLVQISPKETCLLLGSQTITAPQKQLRWLASHPIGAAEDKEALKGMVLYGVKNAEQVLQMVSHGVAA